MDTGSFGTVRVGVDKSTGRSVAIKTLPKFQISQPDVMQSEIRILRVRALKNRKRTSFLTRYFLS